LDLYFPPATDTAKLRPLVLYIHGGGFKDPKQTKIGGFQTRVGTSLARKGYVVASINYRLTLEIPDNTTYLEAMIRAVQDAKAAVRFCRQQAIEYKIDTSKIIAMGSSAGAITALHLAYLDSLEVPSSVRWANIGGTFSGHSNTLPQSARIHGVINCWGALGDTSWMAVQDVPVYSIHGTNDKTVSYDSVPSYKAFNFGSNQIYQAAVRRGIKTGLRLFDNTGHTLDNNPVKQDSAVVDLTQWLFETIRVPQSHR